MVPWEFPFASVLHNMLRSLTLILVRIFYQCFDLCCALVNQVEANHSYRPAKGDIGYGVGGEAPVYGKHLNYYTEGYLLQYCATIEKLAALDALIIDECHEQSMHMDAVVELAEILVKEKYKTKIIFMSATLQGTP